MATVKVQFSRNYEAVRSRIRRLPKLTGNLLRAALKKDAVQVIKEFQKGIITRSFQLRKLKDGTIKRKKTQGMENPYTPLYGLGLDEDKSYINMMRIRKLKNGWKVSPSTGKHHKSKLKLRDLLTVHEFGTIIRGRGDTLIMIPARPAFLKAQEKVLKMKKKEEPSIIARRAISNYIRDGRERHFITEEARLLEGLAKFEE